MRLALCFLMLTTFAVGCGGGGGEPTAPTTQTEAPKDEVLNTAPAPPPLPAPQ
ncbi:MAG: hypothetical protein ACKPJJ_18910 [Planctomycetaceae bacterium]